MTSLTINVGNRQFKRNMILSYITTPGVSQLFHPVELQSSLDGSSKSNQAFVVLIPGIKQD
jgi:hypothetical protein